MRVIDFLITLSSVPYFGGKTQDKTKRRKAEAAARCATGIRRWSASDC